MALNIFKLAAVAVLSMGLMACSSTVKRPDAANGGDTYRYHGEKYSAVKVALTSEVQAKLAGNIKFDARKLEQVVTNSLGANGLIDAKNAGLLQIEVSDVRVRSTFNAVMFGFMAGNDHITGTVVLKSTSGAVLHTFEVSAAYALGGFGGGQDDARMNWLYEEFGKLTAAEILRQEKVAQVN